MPIQVSLCHRQSKPTKGLTAMVPIRYERATGLSQLDEVGVSVAGRPYVRCR